MAETRDEFLDRIISNAQSCKVYVCKDYTKDKIPDHMMDSMRYFAKKVYDNAASNTIDTIREMLEKEFMFDMTRKSINEKLDALKSEFNND